MRKSRLRRISRRLSQWALEHMAKPYDSDCLKRSAVVFSPHFDDETLGCGGTILKKTRQGAEVRVIFVTDGNASHSRLISQPELRFIRSNEARNAARLLGLDARHVIFLDYEERKLSERLQPAIEKVTEILQRHRPEEIFLPYSKDPEMDHVVTNRIVLSAARLYGDGMAIYEYPIWFWRHWPWVPLGTTRYRQLLRTTSAILTFELRLLKDFRCRVYVGDVLEQKRLALDQYRSQMTRLRPVAEWRTLPDLSDGQFLECFFQQHEVFRPRRGLGPFDSEAR